MCFSNGRPNGTRPVMGKGLAMMVGRNDVSRSIGTGQADAATTGSAAPPSALANNGRQRTRRQPTILGGSPASAQPTGSAKTTLGS